MTIFEKRKIIIKKAQKTFRERHRDLYNLWGRITTENYRAKNKYYSKGKFNIENVRNLIRKQNNCCYWCNKKFKKYKFEFDHYLPFNHGGTNHAYNIVLVCFKCNRKKRNRHPDEFKKMLDL